MEFLWATKQRTGEKIFSFWKNIDLCWCNWFSRADISENTKLSSSTMWLLETSHEDHLMFYAARVIML